MNKIRIAVIGLGWFGEKHCEALSGIPHAELYALCTRTESRLKALARTFGVRKTYTDYRALLADSDVDAVSVVTMWDQHAAPTLAATAPSGRPVPAAAAAWSGAGTGRRTRSTRTTCTWPKSVG